MNTQMKIYLKAWLEKNLGDDLFVKIISDRYSNRFISITQTDYSGLKNNYPNIKFIKNNIILDKLIKLFSLKKKTLEHIISSRCDIVVYLGGSMFMEPKNSKFSLYKFKKNYYILGSNFGPYHSNRFYELYFNLFKNAKDVCFRDSFSYNLYKSLKNVRMAPDIVFSLNTHNINITQKNKVIISVVNPSNKTGKQYYKDYKEFINKLIYYFISQKFNITLMSFCKKEGDEYIIEDIISKLKIPNKEKKINTYFYSGNITEALNVIGSAKIIIGSRFHANILGLAMKKIIIPIAYSDKTINVLSDLGFKGKIYDIRKKEDMNFDNFDTASLNYKMDISDIKHSAEEHFKALDKILSRKV